MRQISSKNKGSFTIFAITITIVVILVLVMLVKQVQAANEVEYDLLINSVVYDKNGDYIDASSDGKIKKLWTKDYRISLENGNTYDLGKNGVVRSGTSLSVYGGGYKVYEDGDIKTLSSAATITNLSIPDFYKLSDRKYLMVGNDIKLSDDSMTMTSYVIIDLDKAGNAFLRNDKVNIKVVAPVVFKNGNMTFDSANEILTTGEIKTDCKKINGTTSEYENVADRHISNIPDTKSEESEDVAAIQNQTNTGLSGGGGVGGSSNGSSSSDSANGSGTVVKGSEELKETINKIVDSINSQSNNDDNNGAPTQASTLAMNGYSIGVNSLTVDYYVSDASNKYAAVFLEITPLKANDASATQTLMLNKGETRREVYSLLPKTSYQLSLGYVDKYGEKHVVDNSTVRTKQITGEINITKLVGNRIYFNLQLDSQFKISEGDVVVYADGVTDHSLKIDIDAATSRLGWNGSLELTNESATNYLLKVENAVYIENEVKNNIDLKIETTFRNTWYNNFFKSIFG